MNYSNEQHDYCTGNPAITYNQFGKSNAFYVGTILGRNDMDWLMETICDTAGIKPVVSDASMGVEILKRVNRNSSIGLQFNNKIW